MSYLRSGENQALPKPQCLNSNTLFAKQRNKNRTTTKPMLLNTPYFPVPGREMFSSCLNLKPCSLDPSFSPFSPHGMGSLDSMALQFFSPPIHFHTFHIYRVVFLQLWRSFSQSSDLFPMCSKWSDINRVVFQGQGKPRVPLLLCCLTSSPILKWSFPSRAWIFLS